MKSGWELNDTIQWPILAKSNGQLERELMCDIRIHRIYQQVEQPSLRINCAKTNRIFESHCAFVKSTANKKTFGVNGEQKIYRHNPTRSFILISFVRNY